MHKNWTINAGIAYSRARFDQLSKSAGNGIVSDRYNKTPDWSGIVSIHYTNLNG